VNFAESHRRAAHELDILGFPNRRKQFPCRAPFETPAAPFPRARGERESPPAKARGGTASPALRG